jgi:hypothetical protein
MRRSDETTTSPLLDWTASRIPDPVVRLRYLRAVAPPVLRSKACNPLKIIGYLAAGVLTFLAPWSLRFVSAREHSLTPPRPVAMAALTPPAPRTSDPPAGIWQVEKTAEFETYSNGLRIENQFAVGNRQRTYMAFPLSHPETGGLVQTQPVGIVFHTTESLLAPFEPAQNAYLKRVGESLLEYVRRRRAYNYVIDRFGRVYRIVKDSDAANHAGHSVWADDRTLYVNLNDSFLGVSFETRTAAARGGEGISPAQIRAGAMLTEMLRSRYRIAADNCVTHAQVSVNPSNMQIGYHTDWASDFPFEAVGLPDNYRRPLPSLPLFGFRYDETFRARAGSRLSGAAEAAEQQLTEQAVRAGVSLENYRRNMRSRYLRLSTAMKHAAIHAEAD